MLTMQDMALRKSPTRTPALLAANRANARKSTGPRTVEGKNRVVLNELKEGRHPHNFGENLRRAKSQGGRRVVPIDSGTGADRFSPAWLAGGRAEGRAARAAGLVRAGDGRSADCTPSPGGWATAVSRRSATLWAEPWTPLRMGGVGTNPEYAVKSTDRFLTSLARIRVEIKDQRKVPVLKLWVRRSPLCPLPRCVEATLGGFAQAWPDAARRAEGNAEKRGDAAASLDARRQQTPRNKAGMCPRIKEIPSSPLYQGLSWKR
jgi:hypothetical protein